MDKDDYILKLEQALEAVYNWSRAYPPSRFRPPDYLIAAGRLMEAGLMLDPMAVKPHPDYDEATRVLAEVGPMLDLVREDCLRQAIYAIGEMARAALKVEDKVE